MSRDAKFLAIGLSQAAIRVWDLRKSCCLDKINLSLDKSVRVLCVRFSADSSVLSAGCDNGDIVVFSIRLNKRVAILRNPETPKLKRDENVFCESKINSLCFNYFKKHVIASCTENGSVYVWDSVTMGLKCSFVALHAAPASEVAYSPVNKSLLVSVGYDKAIHFLDTEKGTIVRKIFTDFPLCSVSCSPTGDKLLVGTVQGLVMLYSLHRISRDTKAPPLDVVSCHGSSPVLHVEFYIPAKKLSSQAKSKSTVAGSKSRQVPSKQREARTIESRPTNPHNKQIPAESMVTQESKLDSSVTLFSPPKMAETPGKSACSSLRNDNLRTESAIEVASCETKEQIIPEKTAESFSKAPLISSNKVEATTSSVTTRANLQMSESPAIATTEVDNEWFKDTIHIELSRLESKLQTEVKDNKESLLQNMNARLEKLENDINFNTSRVIHESTQNLQLEMMRQFKLQLEDMTQIVADLKVNMEKLQRENAALKREKEIMIGNV